MAKSKVKFISKFYNSYLSLMARTCKISVINQSEEDINNSVVGFWHGESFPMYLLMQRWGKLNVAAVITSDERGDYISSLCTRFGLTPLRLPNGSAARHGINEIIKVGKEDKTLSICFSIDGPLGPYHDPKKMVFHIANYTGKKYVGVRVKVKGKLVLKSRWDKYVVPLPFSRIVFEIKCFGEISKKQLKNYDGLRQDVIDFMEGC